MHSAISLLFAVAASVAPALAFCGAHTHLDRRVGGMMETSNFGYTGVNGPLLWTQLDPDENALCSTGRNQSPINMVQGQYQLIPASDVELRIPDVPRGATFENLGTTVEVVMTGVGGQFVLERKNYTLSQFHFHHPSEHLDSDVSLPMEMHLVFTTEAEEMAVIGVYVDLVDVPSTGEQQTTSKARPSTLLETIFSSVGEIAATGSRTTTRPLVMSELVRQLKAGSFQRYTGSLTTPPCLEKVEWSMATEKLLLSTATFQAARDVLGFNARYTQNRLGEQNLLALAAAAQAPTKTPARAPTRTRANATATPRRHRAQKKRGTWVA